MVENPSDIMKEMEAATRRFLVEYTTLHDAGKIDAAEALYSHWENYNNILYDRLYKTGDFSLDRHMRQIHDHAYDTMHRLGIFPSTHENPSSTQPSSLDAYEKALSSTRRKLADYPQRNHDKQIAQLDELRRMFRGRGYSATPMMRYKPSDNA